MKKYEKILQAEILTEKKNSVKLTLKGGQELVGKSGEFSTMKRMKEILLDM